LVYITQLLAKQAPLHLRWIIVRQDAECNIFSVVDLESGYHQMLMNEDNKSCTAFGTNCKIYHWKVAPMGAYWNDWYMDMSYAYLDINIFVFALCALFIIHCSLFITYCPLTFALYILSLICNRHTMDDIAHTVIIYLGDIYVFYQTVLVVT